MTSEATDRALLARVVARDLAALGELYDRHCIGLYSLALHLLRGNPDPTGAAEDVLCEVFADLWQRPPTVPAGTQTRACLYNQVERAARVRSADGWQPAHPASSEYGRKQG